MELRQLRYFIAVAEELQFTRAAARLHIAQPPLSQQIRLLESELGTSLLSRTTRHVELTPAGHAFLEEARRTVAQAERARDVARTVGESVSAHLVLGFVDSSLYTYLPHLLRAYRRARPRVHVTLQEGASEAQVNALQRGEIQVGLLRRSSTGPQLKLEEIGRERLIVALPCDHPLAGRPAVAVAELEPYPFVLPARSAAPGLLDHLTGLMRRAGFTPRVAEVASEGHTIIGLVGAGVGVSIVPETLAVSGETVTFRPIPRADTWLGMYMAWRRSERSPAVASFLEVARQVRDDGVLPHLAPAHDDPITVHRRSRNSGGTPSVTFRG
jgi:DNA-binding transcriptional LysR family regulator